MAVERTLELVSALVQPVRSGHRHDPMADLPKPIGSRAHISRTQRNRLGVVQALDLGSAVGVMGSGDLVGEATSRRYSATEKAQAVRSVRSLRAELGTQRRWCGGSRSSGAINRVGRACGHPALRTRHRRSWRALLMPVGMQRSQRYSPHRWPPRRQPRIRGNQTLIRSPMTRTSTPVRRRRRSSWVCRQQGRLPAGGRKRWPGRSLHC